MYFSITVGTIPLIIIGLLFIMLVRGLCRRGVIQDKIGLIDKFMLFSLMLHLVWVLCVNLMSKAGYTYLIWDDESYYNFAMGSTSAYESNLYNIILKGLYDIFGKTTVIGRLTNLFFSVATVYPLATIEKRLNNDTEYRASRFFAYSPFMIFISYFEIKDIILMFCFVSAYAIVKKMIGKINIGYMVLLIAICIFMEQIRSGTGVIPIVVLILSRMHALGNTTRQKRLFAAISTAVVIAVGIYIGRDYISYGTYRIERYQNWIFTQFSSGSIYNWFVITKVADIWKFPFCFMLYALQPLDGLSGNMRFYSEFAIIAKIVDVPILLFSIVFLPKYIKKEKWCSLFFVMFYTFTSCINLTNARQGFFLYPIMYLIFFDSLLSIQETDSGDGALSIYKNAINWKQFVRIFQAIWILFVVYQLIR